MKRSVIFVYEDYNFSYDSATTHSRQTMRSSIGIGYRINGPMQLTQA